MTLVQLIVTLIVIGFVLWLIQYIPMDPTIKKIVIAVAAIVLIIWLLSVVGMTLNVGEE